ncbi:hypothetical protein V6Z12_D09G241700 [Gossypium hirsutum]
MESISREKSIEKCKPDKSNRQKKKEQEAGLGLGFVFKRMLNCRGEEGGKEIEMKRVEEARSVESFKHLETTQWVGALLNVLEFPRLLTFSVLLFFIVFFD